MDRFKFDVFAAKSAAISSSVLAILSFSANLQITTAGLKDIAGTERGWGDLGIGIAQNAKLIFPAIFAVDDPPLALACFRWITLQKDFQDERVDPEDVWINL